MCFRWYCNIYLYSWILTLHSHLFVWEASYFSCFIPPPSSTHYSPSIHLHGRSSNVAENFVPSRSEKGAQRPFYNFVRKTSGKLTRVRSLARILVLFCIMRSIPFLSPSSLIFIYRFYSKFTHFSRSRKSISHYWEPQDSAGRWLHRLICWLVRAQPLFELIRPAPCRAQPLSDQPLPPRSLGAECLFWWPGGWPFVWPRSAFSWPLCICLFKQTGDIIGDKLVRLVFRNSDYFTLEKSWRVFSFANILFNFNVPNNQSLNRSSLTTNMIMIIRVLNIFSSNIEQFLIESFVRLP